MLAQCTRSNCSLKWLHLANNRLYSCISIKTISATTALLLLLTLSTQTTACYGCTSATMESRSNAQTARRQLDMSAQQLWLDGNCLTGHGGLRLAHALQYAAALPPMPVCTVLITPLSFCSVLLSPNVFM